MNPILWQPDPETIENAAITQFRQRVATKYTVDLPDYEALHTWSVTHRELFWSEIWALGECVGEGSLSPALGADTMPGAQWFPGLRLNVAENLLRHRDDRLAIHFRCEESMERQLSFAELHDQVAKVADGFRRLGLEPGDRVAAFVPNVPEAVVAMLAVTSLGGVWTSCSPDFGVQGVLDRFGQVEPRFLIAADGYRFKGKNFDRRPQLAEILAGLPTVERCLVISYLEDQPDVDGLRDCQLMNDWIHQADCPDLSFVRLPFDHPMYIMYSSGTTGVPKAIVHGAGGTLLQHIKEHRLHTNLGAHDRLFYFTTCGWMMWNWLVSALAGGTAIMLFEGNPFYPGPEVLFRWAQDQGITAFGTSAKYVDAVKKSGLVPKDHFDLSKVKTLLSTGSPLVPESFDFVYEAIGDDLCVSSITGGTDIISCFALGHPAGPVRRGELQVKGLGMDVAVFDGEGNAVVGQPGELVCRQAFVSMPIGFWNDDQGHRYRTAYFEAYDGVWTHGDWVEETESGGLIVYGRSDATLNPGGVRIGTAEIYRQVEQMDAVVEAICVGQDYDGDQRVILFVILRDGLQLDDEFRGEIRRQIRAETTPRHVPAVIAQVPDIPRTKSGKIVELAVKKMIHGQDVKNRAALANPEALEHFRNRSELKA
ncbi:MAG TPA: acetoacetate--CoA ligase [Myxococcales bacterium]|nr:acetoacetate--CoA ligase [Myxococcales bacterium]HBU47483.1 acetoacetate--CoA ligase [Myxococcales bacterium]